MEDLKLKKGTLVHYREHLYVVLKDEEETLDIKRINNPDSDVGYFEVIREQIKVFEKQDKYFEDPRKKNKDKIKIIKDSLEAVFPGEYELILQNKENVTNHFYFLEVIIHFPCINIQNSKKKSHIIYDLFVKIFFTEELLIPDYKSLRAMRTKVSYDEYVSGYRHSHRIKGYDTQKETFEYLCTGDSSFNAQLIEMTQFNNWNQEKFELFLYSLQGYLEWESLEGGPYIKMEDISVKKEVGFNTNETNTYARDFMNKTGELTPFKVSYNFLSCLFEVNHESIEEMAIKYFPDIPTCIKTSEGEYYSRYNIFSKEKLKQYRDCYKTANEDFIFKGKSFPFEIFKNDTHDENLNKIVPNIHITNRIVECMEYEMNKYFINKK